MARLRVLFTALASAALAAGCGSMENAYPTIAPSNATVARVLMQAGAPLAAAAAPTETAGVAPVALEVDKPGKRTRARADKAAPQPARAGARPAGTVAPASTSAAAARGTAVQYRYLVELDRGGLRSFDFPVDQKLHAGDRVFVTESGQLDLK